MDFKYEYTVYYLINRIVDTDTLYTYNTISQSVECPIYDSNGYDISADIASGKTITPPPTSATTTSGDDTDNDSNDSTESGDSNTSSNDPHSSSTKSSNQQTDNKPDQHTESTSASGSSAVVTSTKQSGTANDEPMHWSNYLLAAVCAIIVTLYE